MKNIKEVGGVEEKIVLRELSFEVSRDRGNLSTAAWLRQMVTFPFSIVRELKDSGTY
ncbi:MAG TPA: hypothetical protein VMW42_13785 [Desulfatiglandales bacterium]|nr:hypothetical protein [Desulfatiglandales bacterium]